VPDDGAPEAVLLFVALIPNALELVEVVLDQVIQPGGLRISRPVDSLRIASHMESNCPRRFCANSMFRNGLVDYQNYRREQAEWLKVDLESAASRKAAFRIIFSHIPPRGAEGFAIQDVRRNFEELANKAGVDLWLSGHTHRFQLVAATKDQNTYPLMIGATDTITRVEVSRDRLKLMAVRMSGQELLPPVQFERRRGNRQPAP
jgi:hypothetical protein